MPRTLNRREYFLMPEIEPTMQIKILCCNKKIKPEKQYRIIAYPYHGDMTDLYQAICPHCLTERFAYNSYNFKGFYTGLMQADKRERQKFSTILKVGNYQIIENPDPDDKPTKAAMYAGEYTMKIANFPVDAVGHYLRKITRAERMAYA